MKTAEVEMAGDSRFSGSYRFFELRSVVGVVMHRVDCNPLVSYVVLLMMSLFAVMVYQVPAAGYGTFNANSWYPEHAALFIMTSSILLFFGVGFYVVREFDIDVKSLVESQVDMEVLKGVKYISLLSKHYGALTLVCTLVVFVIYLLKRFMPFGGVMLVSLLMTAAVVAFVGLYLLIFSRTLMGSLDRHPMQVSALLVFLIFDAAFMGRAIELA